MTGKQIADNLRGTELKWCTGNLWDSGVPKCPCSGCKTMNTYKESFCVLGIKALEHGVTREQLKKAPSPHVYGSWHPTIEDLYRMNDASATKKSLIKKLELPENINKDFAVELFIEKMKKVKVAKKKRE